MAEIEKIKRINIENLIPYVNNAKQHPEEQITKIASSIREFGFISPVLIDENNNVIAGHGRLLAAKKLGLESVPCVYVEGLNDEQRKAYILADNRLGELTGWDMELVNAELELLQNNNFDISLTGFEINADIPDDEIIEDEAPEAPEEPSARLGDVYQLGKHRIMCGDSTNAEDVKRLMNGAVADMALTDPPYNVDYTGRTKNKLKIENDKFGEIDFLNFLSKAFGNMKTHLKDGGSFYIWYAHMNHSTFDAATKRAGLLVRQCLVWVKSVIAIGRADYQWKHEPCLYGWKDGAAHYFVDDRTQSTVFERDRINPKKLKKDELIELVEELTADRQSTTVFHEDKPARNEMHPTMKPVKLFAKQIKNSTKQGETVLDLFCGSGTSLIACEQLNRTCFAMEYDPKYIDVIIARWENMTGKKAVLVDE